MAGDRPTEAATLRTVERLIAEALPPGWSLRVARDSRRRRGPVEAEWSIRAPDGSSASFIVGARSGVLARDLDRALARLASYEGLPLIAAPYVGPSLRATLARRGVSYADTTGNVRLVADRPGLFIERQGASKDPWPSDEALRSLRGRGAGRAVRALVDFRPPYKVRDLATDARVPLGSLSRTLDLMDREGLVTRDTRGSVIDVDWEGAIRRWSQDYDFARSNQVSSYLDPRGLTAITAKLSEVSWPYAISGAFAAQRFAPVAPARQAAIYVDDPVQVAERLKLRPVDAGANVLLVEPFDPVVFERSTVRDDLRVVAASQLAVDLLTGPGREPSQGDELLSWMRENEDAWRA